METMGRSHRAPASSACDFFFGVLSCDGTHRAPTVRGCLQSPCRLASCHQKKSCLIRSGLSLSHLCHRCRHLTEVQVGSNNAFHQSSELLLPTRSALASGGTCNFGTTQFSVPTRPKTAHEPSVLCLRRGCGKHRQGSCTLRPPPMQPHIQTRTAERGRTMRLTCFPSLMQTMTVTSLAKNGRGRRVISSLQQRPV